VPPRRSVDPHELRTAVAAVEPWLDGTRPEPPPPELATAVRLSLRTLGAVAPGGSVEVRVPPFGVTQCVAGPQHKRGTPPNVVQTDPRTWLQLVTGRIQWRDAVHHGRITASGTRAAEVAAHLPLVRTGNPPGV
jgi:Bacterial SCP ortholog